MMSLRRARTLQEAPRVIREQAQKNNETVYGAQALNKQVPGVLQRVTQDYDVYSPQAQRSAQQLKKNLDKQSGGQNYYTKPAMHPGTYKVEEKGIDNRQGTRDDIAVADYTQRQGSVPYKIINGVRYVTLRAIEHQKKTILQDPTASYRYGKERQDLAVIKESRVLKRANHFFPRF